MNTFHDKINLNGFWDFTTEADGDIPKNFQSTMTVPGCFDVAADYLDYRGICYYRKFIDIEEKINCCLKFEGVAHNAKIFFDRKMLAKHHGAFTGFEVDLGRVESGRHEVIAQVDNNFDGLNRPLHMEHFDWYSYGGIIRPVTLKCWKEVNIKQVWPVITDWKSGKFKLFVEFVCDLDCRDKIPIRIFIDDKLVYDEISVVNKKQVEIDLQIDSPISWTCEKPHLYPVKVVIGDDEMTVNVGLRSISCKGKNILLNDEVIRIKGINRHDIQTMFGFALPDAVILNDVKLIKRLGANFVRTSHYPPSQKFIDYCDKLGVMVWCEATGWGYNQEMILDSRLQTAQYEAVEEMVRQYHHHPSIVFWGFLNESASHIEKARPFYERLASQIRKLDPTRLLTYASNKFPPDEVGLLPGQTDLMFDLVDVIALNAYPGWYGGTLDDCKDRIDGIIKKVEKAGLANKPFVISEIGAEGLSGFDTTPPVKWSLSYQKDLLKRTISHIRFRKDINGVFVWHFSDIRTSCALWHTRARGYNNKGILDEHRVPKQAYEELRQIFHNDW